MKETPISLRCREILDKKDHILIGISPLNSYYSEERIVELINWGNTKFKNFHILTADTLHSYNFMVMGYPLNKVRKKTQQNWNSLYNKIIKAFLKLKIPENIYQKKIIALSGNIPQKNVYNSLYNIGLNRYNNDSIFRQKCHDACRIVLQNYVDIISDIELETASKYLLEELPFYLDTPRILGLGSSLLAYHKAIPFFEDLYINRELNFVSNNQGHLILE